jgi:prolyl oligopeptidase PreP (S9A serine peptidase family)
MVQCPTKGGFKPYSTESFLATMKIKVMKSGKLIETAEIPGGALEFGGQWLANDCYTRSRFLML